ncbi:hypothetical protein ACFQT0_10615 [Hymenobacter humi]|uniref:Thioredoxin domain-containing protein n=1 Tax=Hymenobacter humi TaxID=1411620 RepID=A0ABW2U339_9BACT
MSFSTSFRPIRVALFGLSLAAVAPAHAQQATVKVKTKTETAGTKVSKNKNKLATPAPAPSAPQPKSPLISAPQVIVDAPVVAGEAAAPGWLSDLSAAKAQAKATNRPIVAVFRAPTGASPASCTSRRFSLSPSLQLSPKTGWCWPTSISRARSATSPRPPRLKLNEAAAGHQPRRRLPLAVIISPEGKVLAKTGYIAGGPAAFEAYLKK